MRDSPSIESRIWARRPCRCPLSIPGHPSADGPSLFAVLFGSFGTAFEILSRLHRAHYRSRVFIEPGTENEAFRIKNAGLSGRTIPASSFNRQSLLRAFLSKFTKITLRFQIRIELAPRLGSSAMERLRGYSGVLSSMLKQRTD